VSTAADRGGKRLGPASVVSSTSEPDPSPAGPPEGSHRAAASAFARRVDRDPDLDAVEELYLFGSTARDEAEGLASDVDFLAVVADDADRSAVADRLRAVAYDVTLEFGPVVEVHVLSRTAFDGRRDHPFVRRVREEGRSYG
jgi:predicted nucleotidyltransferase